jgi:hypothetical protein
VLWRAFEPSKEHVQRVEQTFIAAVIGNAKNAKKRKGFNPVCFFLTFNKLQINQELL